MAQQVKDAVVRLKAADGTWEACGTDRARGIVVENLTFASDLWGPKTASFDLHRDPAVPWPDITAYADVEIDIGAVQVWKGRVRETPTGDLVINVQCDGLQSHLDDDVLQPLYVHTRLTDLKDVRSHPSSILTRFRTNGSVQVDQGAVVLGWPSGAAVTTGDAVGVVLDLGPGNTAKRATLSWSNQGVAAGTDKLVLFGCDQPSDIVLLGDGPVQVDPASATSPQTASFTTSRRYVVVYVYHDTGAVTQTADRLVRITGLTIYQQAAYEAGNASTLKASTVVLDALARATMLLDPDRSLIATTTFVIPELWGTDFRSAREVIDAVNAFHSYITKIDERGRPVFQPRPTTATVEVGEWAGMEVQDSSANSGEDIYNKVIVTGTTAADTPVAVERYAALQAGADVVPITTPAMTNPSFDTATTGWTAGASTITRDTATFDTTPAAGRWDNTGANDSLNSGDTLTASTSGTFQAGVRYTVRIRSRGTLLNVGNVLDSEGYKPVADYKARFGTATDYAEIQPIGTLNSGWQTFQLVWTPKTTVTSGVNLTFTAQLSGGTQGYYHLDTVQVLRAVPTIVDRRGFQRTKVLPYSGVLDTGNAIASQIGDAYLANHKSAQFRGTAKIIGPAREVLTGRAIPPEQICMRTGELLRFGDRIDPDTGAVGRDGRIVQASYDLATDAVTVSIDNTSTNFEALLARLAVIQGAS